MRNPTGFPKHPPSGSRPLNGCGKLSMAMIHLPQDFKEFLKLLNAHRVEYLMIGGYAVGYYGYPRATADMDIWVAVNPANADKIVAVLKEFGFNLPDLSAELFLKEWQIIRMGVPPVRIELSTSVSGVNFSECYANKVIDAVDGVQINLISLEHLKQNKKSAARHKDLADLENLP